MHDGYLTSKLIRILATIILVIVNVLTRLNAI